MQASVTEFTHCTAALLHHAYSHVHVQALEPASGRAQCVKHARNLASDTSPASGVELVHAAQATSAEL